MRLLAWLLLAGCGGAGLVDGGTSSDGGDDAGRPDAGFDAGAPDSGSDGGSLDAGSKDSGVNDAGDDAGNCVAAVGNATYLVLVGGEKRAVDVHAAPSSDGGRRPVVLAFHGAGQDAPTMRADSHFDTVADERGLIVVYPHGTYWTDGGNPGATWNVNDVCCGPASDLKVDDVAFTSAIIDQVLLPGFCADPKRIYSTGFSNGGFFSHHLGCRLANRIAAIAPVSGTNISIPCTPSRAVAVLQIHGTADPAVLYDGGGVVPSSPPVFQSTSDWATRNGCGGNPVVSYQQGEVRCVSWPVCPIVIGTQVELCAVADAGHVWPGGLNYPGPNLDASRAMTDFFLRHALP